jgi:hypothetical protein
MSETIFVFGSNLAGRHGKGAALEAHQWHGAAQGVGSGPTGNSYALPTKRTPWTTLSLTEIELHVKTFIEYAVANDDKQFFVTAVGCGLAGYLPEDIAPMFGKAPPNCILPPEFKAVLSKMEIG